MDTIRQYILSITGATIICSLVTSLLGKREAYAQIVKLLAGIFIVVTAVSPIRKIQLSEYLQFEDSLSAEADAVVQEGEFMAEEAMKTIIMEQVEAYILDKATSLGLEIDVEVVVSMTSPPVPTEVIISGAASPYGKSKLKQYIIRDLQIPEENIRWK